MPQTLIRRLKFILKTSTCSVRSIYRHIVAIISIDKQLTAQILESSGRQEVDLDFIRTLFRSIFENRTEKEDSSGLDNTSEETSDM